MSANLSSVNANAAAVAGFTKTTHTDTYEYISPKNADLSGRSVFIAGASQGIGRQTALSFAAAGCGKIAIGARSDLSSLESDIREAATKAGRAQAPQVVRVKLDVVSEDSVKAAAETVGREFGGALDVLINNAGYLEEWRNVADADADAADWWKSYEVNVKGTYLCNKYFIPLLLAGELKISVLTSSYGALRVRPGASGYQSAKFAVVRLAEFIAAEYGDRGVICFALHPGGVATELALCMPPDMHQVLVDKVELSGDAICWMASARRPWMSSRYFSITWDMEELEARKDEIVEKDLLRWRMTT
ncbi:NAD(P)-binding protein [Xylariomycetidae sp. FL2044]|nr:NAD(P)-binding protein [Xylariomycetidae sp. FL2044]